MTTYYKFLGTNRMPIYGVGQWHPNAWMPYREPILCESGYHVCTATQLINWIGPELWEVKLRGEIVHGDDKSVASEARLVRRVTTWNDRTARLFAADCAERALPIFEAERPDDLRPRAAIEVARRFANGEASDSERRAAWDAAWAAAGDAARAAAWDAAWDAARAAARAAAWDAARDAAWDAARAAAWDAAWDAAGDAAGAAARRWQSNRLLELVGIDEGTPA